MKPYSIDLRMRVLAAVDAGKPREEIAETFSVSEPTIKRWLRRRRESGDVDPKPVPGRPSVKEAALKEWLPSHLPANDDLTLEAHREPFEEVGMLSIRLWVMRDRSTMRKLQWQENGRRRRGVARRCPRRLPKSHCGLNCITLNA